MLSRVAESIYWLHRYVERLENYSRFIIAHLNLSLDVSDDFSEQWLPLIATSGDEALFQQHYPTYSKKNVLQFLTFDPFNPNSILNCITMARENARSVRESISSEMWNQINDLYHHLNNQTGLESLDTHSLITFYEGIKESCYHFTGIVQSTLTHGEGWHFGRLGTYLERIDKLTRLIDVKYYYLLPEDEKMVAPIDLAQWVSVLKSLSSYEMYRKEYGLPTPLKIAEFLILNTDFPRSVRHCLIQAQKSLHALTGNERWTFNSSVEKKLGRMRTNLDYIEINEIIAYGLHEYMDTLQIRANEVSNLLYQEFFSVHVESDSELVEA